MAIFLIFIVCLPIFIFIYYHQKKNYWARRKIPGPPPKIFFGNFLELTNPDTLNVLVLQEWSKIYGSVYGVQEGLRNVLVISDPDLVQEVFIRKFECFYARKLNSMANDSNKGENVQLFNAAGSKWKRLRYLSNQIFGIGNLKKMFPIIQNHSEILIQKLSDHALENSTFDIISYFQEFSMNLMLHLTLGIDYSSSSIKNPYLEDFIQTFDRSPDREISILCASLPWFKNWINCCRKKFYSSNLSKKSRIYQDLSREVHKKKENGLKDDCSFDIISLFLQSEVDSEVVEESFKKLSIEEIVAQCFVILLAGFGGVSTSLSFLTHCLAINQDAQKLLFEEIEEIDINESVSYEKIQSMRYLDAVVKESLRLYPVAARSASRLCTSNTTIGKYEIEEDTFVMVDVFTLHRNEKIWGPDPNEFIPERWLSNTPPSPCFLTFGYGSRSCLGFRLALMQIKLALINLLKNYIIEKAPETIEKLKLVGAVSVLPKEVVIKVSRR